MKDTKHKFYISQPAYCIGCGTGEKRHKAEGKCNTCYMRDYMKRRKKLSPTTP